MNRPDPAAVINGVSTGHICDSCNRRIEHGEKVGMYVTFYEEGGWMPRRTWCLDCCPEEVDPGTDGVDEAILLGVLFSRGLVSISILDRNQPRD